MLDANDTKAEKVRLDDLLCLPGGDQHLKAVLSSAERIRPGFRTKIPYASVGDGEEYLHYLIPYQAADDPTPPQILQEVWTKEGKVTKPMDIPFAWTEVATKVFEVHGDRAMIGSPDYPEVWIDQIVGIGRRQTKRFNLPGDKKLCPEFWNSLGFPATRSALENWNSFNHASASVADHCLATKHKGWFRMPDRPESYYAYAENMVIPTDGQEVQAISSSSVLGG